MRAYFGEYMHVSRTTTYAYIIVQLCRYGTACLNGRNECEIGQSCPSRAMIYVELIIYITFLDKILSLTSAMSRVRAIDIKTKLTVHISVVLIGK